MKQPIEEWREPDPLLEELHNIRHQHRKATEHMTDEEYAEWCLKGAEETAEEIGRCLKATGEPPDALRMVPKP